MISDDDNDDTFSPPAGAQAIVEGIANAPVLAPVAEGDISELPLHQFDGSLDTWCARRATNDLGNAERLRARFGADLLYVRGVGWHAWDGVRWNRGEGDDRAHLAAQRTAIKIRREAKAAEGQDKKRCSALLAHAHETGGSSRIAAMQREARPHLAQPLDALDSRPELLVLSNGTLELSRRPRLRHHRREDLLTRLAPVAYDPDADYPVFKEFLHEVQPDPAIREFLQRWFGYCLTGWTHEQVMVICHGAGANGKSTLLDALRSVMGDIAVVLPFASLLHDDRRRGSEASPDIAQLPGARLVTASEPELGRSFSEATIKTLTGEGRISARQLHQEFFEFTPQFKLVVSCNNRPTVRGQDEGIWRRMLLVPFGVTIPPEQRDKKLLEKLAAELSGILNWLVQGASLYLETGLQVPDGVRAATEGYRQDSDPLGEFLSAWCVRGPAVGHTSSQMLYEAYKAWCQDQALEPVTRRVFGLKLGDRGIAKMKSSEIVYLNIELTDAARGELDARRRPQQGAPYADGRRLG